MENGFHPRNILAKNPQVRGILELLERVLEALLGERFLCFAERSQQVLVG